MKKGNKANREDIMERIAIWLLLALFWSMIIFQIAKVTIIVILSGVSYSIINLYLCYKLLERKTKKIIEGFLIVEMIPFFFIGIVAIFQAII